MLVLMNDQCGTRVYFKYIGWGISIKPCDEVVMIEKDLVRLYIFKAVCAVKNELDVKHDGGFLFRLYWVIMIKINNIKT